MTDAKRPLATLLDAFADAVVAHENAGRGSIVGARVELNAAKAAIVEAWNRRAPPDLSGALDDFEALITDIENKWGDPHTLRHAKESLRRARQALAGASEPWRRCPSTHCERRGECASPNDCIVKSALAGAGETPTQPRKMKLQFTNEWLKKKIEADPDIDVEAGGPPELTIDRCAAPTPPVCDRNAIVETDELVEKVARAICREKCAYCGEPPCFEIRDDHGQRMPWPNPNCDEPGCQWEARAAIRALSAPKLPEPGFDTESCDGENGNSTRTARERK